MLLGQDLCCLFLAGFGIAPVRPAATVHLCYSAGKETIGGGISRLCQQAHFWCGSCQVWSGSEQLLVPGSGHCLVICQCGRGACLLCWQTRTLLSARPGRQVLASAEQPLSKIRHSESQWRDWKQTELCATTDGQDQAASQARIFSFSFDVYYESPLLVPGWPAVRD